jgi:F-type H+-transporting ATPase subunit gamma
MASLKDMRNRIGGVKSTQKITKAMQMVAAAKLKRAQNAAESARPYAARMAAVIGNLASGVSGADAPRLLAGTGSEQKHLVVVATADRGLAGGFNSAIVRAARDRINALINEGRDVRIVSVGKKGRDPLRRLYRDRVVESFDLSAARTLSLETAQPIADFVLAEFEAGRADVVTLFYSRFRSVISQVPTARQLIPAVIEEAAEAPAGDERRRLRVRARRGRHPGGAASPQPDVQILSALFENAAGEQGARMQAMDNATRNAGELIGALTMQYNRQRQAAITTELIEIIAGAEAL